MDLKVSKGIVEDLTKLAHAYINSEGKEVLNPVPHFISVGSRRKPFDTREEIRRILRQELSMEMKQQGVESFDEADDFDIEDDFELDLIGSRYALVDDEIPIAKDEEPEQSILNGGNGNGLQQDPKGVARNEPGPDQRNDGPGDEGNKENRAKS